MLKRYILNCFIKINAIIVVLQQALWMNEWINKNNLLEFFIEVIYLSI